MSNCYSNERDMLELVALIRQHHIRYAVVSPGSTNISFAQSLLYDPDIKVFSSVDERSAAYMACGLAAETGEPVIISCTGATAARNYVPALTEAYYRHLPILAVTSSQHFGRVGQYIPQVTDRTNPMNDIFTKSVQIPVASREEDRWANNLKINDALLELRRRGGGPVHINIETSFSGVFDVKKLPDVRVIRRYTAEDALPKLKAEKVIVFVGSHARFDEKLTEAVDKFCRVNNAVVLCDQTGNYKGKYRVFGGLTERQNGFYPPCRKADLLIHIGDVSGAYYTFDGIPVWRVHPDGEVRDTFKHLTSVFEMSEMQFFSAYNHFDKKTSGNSYIDEWKKTEERLQKELPELPFSNAWLAKQTAPLLPADSEIHFGILNSLRMWNCFDVPPSVTGFSNVGGFGIDGCISTVLGASLANTKKLYYLVVGDLATFYDLNALGNRHFGNNVRILVVNNGVGFEMRHRHNRGDVFGEDANELFAAGGHFGDQSRVLLKHFAEDLGFEYLSAENKQEYLEHLPRFTAKEELKKPVLFEVFVKVEDEYEAYEMTRLIEKDSSGFAKTAVMNLIGEKGVQKLKGMMGK